MESNQNKIESFIDELQEVIEESPNAMLSKKKAVELDLVLEILDDMRNSIPEEIKYCEGVMRDKQQILDSARSQADKIIADAKAKAEELVAEHSIMAEAQERAQNMLLNAKSKSRDLKSSATNYADEVMSELESYFMEYAEVIRENKTKLHNKAEFSASQVSEED